MNARDILRTKETIAKLEYQKKLLEFEIEDIIINSLPPCKTCPALDEYCVNMRNNRIEILTLQIKKYDIEIKYLYTKIPNSD